MTRNTFSFLLAEHYVQVTLLRKGIPDTVKQTKHKNGLSPAWNEAFLFDVPSHMIKSYSLEFVIKRGKMLSRDEVVGHVLIGPDATQNGTAHWREITESYGLESTKGHSILPVLNY